MFDKRLFTLPGAKSAIAWCIATSLLLAAFMVGQAATLAWALTLLLGRKRPPRRRSSAWRLCALLHRETGSQHHSGQAARALCCGAH